MHLHLRILFLLVFSIILAQSAWAWEGKVVGVIDGDSITVLHEGRGEQIRLYGIDCPEKHQDFGQKAKEFTSLKVFGKQVDVLPITQDRYHRIVAIVSLNGSVLNRAIIEAGYGWVYRQYCTKAECQEWSQLEQRAKDTKLGLWSMPNPVPPWDFRRGNKTSRVARTDESQSGMSLKSATVYHGNVSSRIFHAPVCRYYDCKNCTTIFKSREEAVQAGFRPCKICNP